MTKAPGKLGPPEALSVVHEAALSATGLFVPFGSAAMSRRLLRPRGLPATPAIASILTVARRLYGIARHTAHTALTGVAEIGDLMRFTSPRQLMSYLGPVLSESSSGATTRRGGITKTGNGHIRRVLTEATWCYCFPARKTAHLTKRAAQTDDTVQAIAWKVQKQPVAALST